MPCLTLMCKIYIMCVNTMYMHLVLKNKKTLFLKSIKSKSYFCYKIPFPLISFPLVLRQKLLGHYKRILR